MSSSFDYDVIIAGGGPAGSSAAIHLAQRGVRVLLAEQKQYPRQKLCGEFISPECLAHFEKLGVSEQMQAAREAQLHSTVFYAPRGNSANVPSTWFGNNQLALGLSRAEMDHQLLRRASAAGVTVLEETQAGALLINDGRVEGAQLRSKGNEVHYRARITIDATGRAGALAHRLNTPGSSSARSKRRATLVAFKAHLEDVRIAPGTCEIYFYRGGYGGLSSIEGSLSNLCFIASARDVRACGADAERVLREVVCQNARARHTLANARRTGEWLAVTLEGFGRRRLVPAQGLIAIGDAASFIDPFSGSGMLMAFENGELAAEIVASYLPRLGTDADFERLARDYRTVYRRKFRARLRVCGMLRRAAFTPGLAAAAIHMVSVNDRLCRTLARATRGPSRTRTYVETRDEAV
ncbi:MAG: NAD(P)/FAD-dependent oxidoreductase [Pyrinomonadaceae bacterium]